MIEVEEITVGEAFERPRTNYTVRACVSEKKVTCHNCEKERDTIYMVNKKFGLCLCGTILFDWRPLEEIGSECNKEDKIILKKVRGLLQVLNTDIRLSVGIPVELTDLATIGKTIEGLKVMRKFKQGKTIYSLKGIVNKIKYYLLGYVLEETRFKMKMRIAINPTRRK